MTTTVRRRVPLAPLAARSSCSPRPAAAARAAATGTHAGGGGTKLPATTLKGSGSIVPGPVRRGGLPRLHSRRAAERHGQLQLGRLRTGPDRPAGWRDRLRRFRQPRPRGRRTEVQGRVPVHPDRVGTDHDLVQPERRRASSRSRPPTIAKIFATKITKWNDAGDHGRQPRRDPAVDVDHRRAPQRRLRHDGQLHEVPHARRPRATGRSEPARPSTGRAPRSVPTSNAGVAAKVKSTDGAIGYVDFSDATTTGLTFASVKNSAGTVVAPTLAGATAAMASATVTPDVTVSPMNASGCRRVPDHVAHVHHRVREADRPRTRATALKALLEYVLGAGQSKAAGARLRQAARPRCSPRPRPNSTRSSIP